VLLLWGPKSSGKTGALQMKAEEWEKKGHPVIVVDLKGFDGNLQTFALMLQEATTSALERHHRELPEELIRKALEKQQSRWKAATSKVLDSTTRGLAKKVARLWRPLAQLISDYFHEKVPAAKTVENVITPAVAVGPWLVAMNDFITARLRTPKVADFVTIFELLEEIARLQQDPSFLDTLLRKPKRELKPPIVIIREIQRLDDLNDDPELGRRVFERLFQYFEPRKQRESRVPVILESSDFLWSRMKELLSSKESFRPLVMPPLERADAEEWLVKQTLDGQTAPVFTEDEFEKVWNVTGGHAGSIYSLHSYLIDGNTLDKAIISICLENDGIVRDLIWKGDVQKRKDRITFLFKLRENGYKFKPSLGLDQDPEALYFTQRNILFFDGKIATSQNVGYQQAIERFLNEQDPKV